MVRLGYVSGDMKCNKSISAAQVLPSGTDVSELPARIRVSSELERLFRSNWSMSEM